MTNHLQVFLISIITLCCISHAAAEPIRIGAIMPLSGEVAPWGERVRIGLETANEMQGRRFAVSFEDEGACEAQKALTAYRKLISVDRVKVVFVACLSGIEAIAPIAAKDGVLLLSLGLLNAAVLDSGANLVDLATEIGTESIFWQSLLSRKIRSAPPVSSLQMLLDRSLRAS